MKILLGLVLRLLKAFYEEADKTRSLNLAWQQLVFVADRGERLRQRSRVARRFSAGCTMNIGLKKLQGEVHRLSAEHSLFTHTKRFFVDRFRFSWATRLWRGCWEGGFQGSMTESRFWRTPWIGYLRTVVRPSFESAEGLAPLIASSRTGQLNSNNGSAFRSNFLPFVKKPVPFCAKLLRDPAIPWGRGRSDHTCGGLPKLIAEENDPEKMKAAGRWTGAVTHCWRKDTNIVEGKTRTSRNRSRVAARAVWGSRVPWPAS